GPSWTLSRRTPPVWSDGSRPVSARSPSSCSTTGLGVARVTQPWAGGAIIGVGRWGVKPGAMMDGGISTDEIMRIALDLVGATAAPGDSAIYVSGSQLKRVMIGIDVGVAELLLARQLGVDGAIAHHPAGGSAVLDFPKVLVRGVDLMVEAGVPEEVA